MSGRFPGWVYREGDEPDPRFSLANERTFLAWIRTALGLMVLSTAVLALDLVPDRGDRLLIAAAFGTAGLLAVVIGWVSWSLTERQMRRGLPLPGAGASALFTVVLLAAMFIVVTTLLVAL